MSEVLERKPTSVVQSEGIQDEPPPMFHVVLRDLTGMDTNEHCIVTVLREVFNMNVLEAFDHVAEVERTGRTITGTFTKDIARTKAYQARRALLEHQDHNPFIALVRFRSEPSP